MASSTLSWGALSTAASLAEMASIYPTSGGQYHWAAMLAPDSYRVILSWFTGWIATLGWVANTAAGAFFAATMIQGVVAQTDPSYSYHRWHGSLLIFAVMLVVFLVNSIGTRLLSMVEGFVLILHLSGFLAILVPLLYFSRQRHVQASLGYIHRSRRMGQQWARLVGGPHQCKLASNRLRWSSPFGRRGAECVDSGPMGHDRNDPDQWTAGLGDLHRLLILHPPNLPGCPR